MKTRFQLRIGASYLHFRAQDLTTSSEWTVWSEHDIVIKSNTTANYTVSYFVLPVGGSYRLSK